MKNLNDGAISSYKSLATLTHHERTDCTVEHDGSLVIGEFVDERGVQLWCCRRESNCHMATH